MRVSVRTVERMVGRRELHAYYDNVGYEKAFRFDETEVEFVSRLREAGYRLRYEPGTLTPPRTVVEVARIDGQPLTEQAVNYQLRTGMMPGTRHGHLRYGYWQNVLERWPTGCQQLIGSISKS